MKASHLPLEHPGCQVAKRTVEWENVGGERKELENDRHLQITYEEPGTYSVTGKLFLDGELVRAQSKTVVVQPLS